MHTRRPEFTRIRVALGASAIFGQVNAPTLDALAEAATIERFDRGGCVSPHNQPRDKLWFVLEGGLLLYWAGPRGDLTPVASVGPGSFYNTSSLVEGGKPSWECRAKRGTVLAAIPGPVVRQRAKQDPDFTNALARILLQRYQATLSAYADAIAEALPVRVARRLLGQALSAGDWEDGKEIPLTVAQADLAGVLGVSRSKLNAELKQLEKQGVIRLGYGKIYVRDVKALEKISGGPVIVF